MSHSPEASWLKIEEPFSFKGIDMKGFRNIRPYLKDSIVTHILYILADSTILVI